MGQAEIAIKTAREQDEITRGRDEPDEPIERETSRDTESPGETTSRDDRPGRQAGRDGRSDELMRTAREEINCHLPGIRPCQGVVWLVSPHRLVFRLVSCLLACRLRFISSSHPVSRYRLVLRLVLSVSLGVSCVSRPVVPRCLLVSTPPPPRPLVRSCGIHYYLPLCPPVAALVDCPLS